MNKSSWSASTDPKGDESDLSLLAGKWQSGVKVKITNPSQIKRGPVKVVLSKRKSKKTIFRQTR